jgi:ADP-heptose:LPS heptosyltransferase
LLQQAAVMVANDTGPGHMAAAVGTPLLSVLGPSDPAQWGAWGPGVQYLQGPEAGAWPHLAQVDSALQALLPTPPQRG